MTSEDLRITSYRIPHRDYLHIFPNGRIAAVASVEVEALEIVDIMLITSLTLDPPMTPAATNNGA